MSALEKLAAFVSTFRPDYRLMEEVRLHVADTLGAWIAATRTEEGKLLTRYRRTGTTPHDRIAINCALARLSEVDDIHLASMTTPGSIIVPSAMTMASVMPHLDSMDVAAAIAGGVRSIGVAGMHHSRDALLESGADAVVNELDEIPRLVAGWSRSDRRARG